MVWWIMDTHMISAAMAFSKSRPHFFVCKTRLILEGFEPQSRKMYIISCESGDFLRDFPPSEIGVWQSYWVTSLYCSSFADARFSVHVFPNHNASFYCLLPFTGLFPFDGCLKWQLEDLTQVHLQADLLL